MFYKNGLKIEPVWLLISYNYGVQLSKNRCPKSLQKQTPRSAKHRWPNLRSCLFFDIRPLRH